MDTAPGDHAVPIGVGDVTTPGHDDSSTDHGTSAAEQAVIQDLLGRPTKKGALKRGFKQFPRMLPYLRPYRKLAVISVILTTLLAVLALAEPWPVAFVVDSIIGNKPAPGWVTGIFGSSTGVLIGLAVAATLFLTLVSGLMTVWNEYLTTTVDQKMVLDLRSQMFQHAQKLSLAFHDTESKGIMMYRINNQAAGLGQIVVGLPAVGQSLLTVIGMAYICVRINPLLALLALGTTPFVVYSTTYYTRKIEPRIYRVRGLGAFNLAMIYESLSMIRVVLAFGTQRREWKRWRQQGEKFVDETVGLTVRQTVFKMAVQAIAAAGTAAVIGVGAYQAVHGEISAGELLVVLSYIAAVYQPLEDLTNTIAGFQQQFIGLLMSFELLDLKPEVTEKSNAVSLEGGLPEIELENVGFGYSRPEIAEPDGEQPEPEVDVLKGISMRIPAGRAVAIVGATGAGKSTLVSLLPRFYDVVEGSVRIDGHDVRDLKLADLRSKFSIVLQEPLLFSGSIASNIRYGKPDASDEEIIEAAKAANAHDFISALPDGYETFLGERGAMISGGERQRIAVARAFLRDAPILILDEPTSSIDSRTESVILEALDRLMEGRTTIMIAHRLSTLRSVDDIIVLDHGEIVQRGTHEELVGQEGLYRELWAAQTRAREGTGPSRPAALAPGRARPVLTSIAGRGAPQVEAGQRPLPPPVTLRRPKIVLLGMLTKIPVGGVAWLVKQYAAGFERLGFEVYYVEAHARTPSMFMKKGDDDRDAAVEKAAAYMARMAKRFGLEGRWAFQVLHQNGRCYGMSAEELDRLYRDAALILNMHGGTLPLPEHVATDRLVFLGTDPVEVELEVERGDAEAIEFLDHHVAHFTWGLNYGNPDCVLPWARPYSFVPSPPPVVLDFWENDGVPDGAPLTTIGNWRQDFREVRFEGHTYRWSKHQQFMKILDLPLRTRARIELALSSYDDRDRLLLAEHGWRVRPGFELSRDLDGYRDYVVGSAGELSAAKEQNVHFRTGWFSERSATYLAAGRPVIVQDTGFGAALPAGEGLLAFSDLDEATEAVAAVQADPRRHRRAALEVAREHLSYDVVLSDMLDHVGLRPTKGRRGRRIAPAQARLPIDLPLDPSSNHSLERGDEVADSILGRPVPSVPAAARPPVATVVVPVRHNLAGARLTLESVLANTGEVPHEVVIVDDGSAEPTRRYLEVLAARNRHLRVIRHEHEIGPVATWNDGLASAGSEVVVLLRSGVIVPPGWLTVLSAHLDDPAIGLVGAAGNRGRSGTRVSASYGTYGEMVGFARRQREGLDGKSARDVDVLDVSCVAARREVLEAVGALDERLEVGRFEADYARRVRSAGYRVACAYDVYAHRFPEPSARKHADHPEPDYAATARRVRAAVRRHVPIGSRMAVVSGGHDELIAYDGREAWHFPRLEDGTHAGYHPADDQEAITGLERLRESGADYLVLPATEFWWLDHYQGFGRHLESYPRAYLDPETAAIYSLGAGGSLTANVAAPPAPPARALPPPPALPAKREPGDGEPPAGPAGGPPEGPPGGGPPEPPAGEEAREQGALARLLRSSTAALALIVGVAFALRWIAAQQSLFGDELFTYAITAQHSLTGFFDQIARTENNPPIFYLVSWLTSSFGDPATLIRLPSVIFGSAAALATYGLGRRVGGRASGLLAAALIAVLPFAVFYGSEARAYGMVMFLAPLSTLVLLRALDDDRRRWWAAYGVIAAVAVYTHYMAGLVLALQALWALYVRRERWRPIVLVNLLVGLAFLPWFVLLGKVNDTSALPLLSFVEPFTAANVATRSLRLLFGHPYADAGQVPGILSLAVLEAAAVVALAAVVVIAVRRRRRPESAQPRPARPARARRELWLLGLLALGIPLLGLAFSAVGDEIYLSRNLIVILPCVCVLVAVGIAALPRRAAVAVAALTLLAAAIGTVRMLTDYPRPDMKAAAAAIQRDAPAGAPVIEPVLFQRPELMQDLSIYLHGHPVAHQLSPDGWPRSRDVYVVLPYAGFAAQADSVAEAAGAHLAGSESFPGIYRVELRHYSR